MLPIDNWTLLVVIVLISICSAMTLAAFWRTQTEPNGIGFWAAGMAFIGLSGVVLLTRTQASDMLPLFIANAGYIIGFQLIFIGVKIFSNRSSSLAFDFAFLPLVAGCYFVLYYIANFQNARVVVFSGAAVLISLAIVYVLLNGANKKQRSTRKIVTVLFALFGFFHFMRAFMAVLFPYQPSLIEHNLATTSLYLGTIFIIIGFTIIIIVQSYSILLAKLRMISLAVDQSASSIVITDDKWNIEYVNPSALNKTGYRLDEVLGQRADIFDADTMSLEDQKKMSDILGAGKIWRGELLTQNKQADKAFWELASISPVKRTNNQIRHFVAVKEDITELKHAKQKIQHLAQHDTLTGLPTRQLIMTRLEKAIIAAKQSNGQLAVLFMDLDGFKSVNDTFGHGTGDALLKSVATRLRSCVRDIDTVARIGGDEFLMLFNGVADQASVAMIAERMLHAIAEPFKIDNQLINISSSIGISMYPDDSQDPLELIKLADLVMYEVKREGKNNVAFVSRTNTEQAASNANEYMI
ncbi:sensor domain-containing diguanylate cyclase [Vibrio algicola]|uniref:Diguanylate cyclase n=1 Tax=Vibrio algicola TaxID=2662262 RepID=A0A5Q0TG58_9VIBR|nr:sensor domain-containing diguanylate cyclase [Vibrio algicola]